MEQCKLFEGMPYVDYDEAEGINHTRLKLFAKSALHFQALSEEEDEPTKSKLLGQMVHALVLQPERFGAFFAVSPSINRRTNAGKEEYQAFLDKNAGKTIVDADQVDEAKLIAESILANEQAKLFLAGGLKEVSFCWTDRLTGVLCKARLDDYSEEHSAIVEIKTTKDASPLGFPRELFNFNHHSQLAFYRRGLEQIGKRVLHCVIIAAETSKPYATVVYRLLDEAIVFGDHQVEEWLKQYQLCKNLNKWPGYSDDVMSIGLPKWAQQKMEAGYV